MLLRPATPLSLIFLAAFVLLLISTLSTPIIDAIPLASFQGYNLGVFGYCKISTKECSPIRVGYSTDGLFTGTNADDFELPSQTRRSLFSILIVHPIATFFALVCLCLAVAAHFRGPSHSPRYLLALLILTIPTLLMTLLAFLVDILLFVPHLSWGGWIVLAATILIIASSVVTCAMRRTLVSRKARKKRIAENADMNGTDYYENLAQRHALQEQDPRAESPPPLGEMSPDKTGPSFATFEMRSRDTQSDNGAPGRRSEDRTPLNPARDPSVRSAGSSGGHHRPHDEGALPPLPLNRQQSSESFGQAGPARHARDQYGNVIQGPAGYSEEASGAFLASDRRGGRGGYSSPVNRGRGYGPPRGAYGGPPRGGYGPPPSGRGGYFPSRGSYGPRGGPRGPPPPGWNGRGRGGYGPPPGQYSRGGMPRSGPPPGYGNSIDYYSAPDDRVSHSPLHEHNQYASDPGVPIGQAVEMDARTGLANPQPVSPIEPTYDNDIVHSSVARTTSPQGAHLGHNDITPPTEHAPDHMPDHNSYMPPRSQWAQQTTSSSQSRSQTPNRHMSPASNTAHVPSSFANNEHRRGGSEDYYEDVDPRFAIDPASDVGSDNNLPSALTPGTAGFRGPAAHRRPSPNHLHPSYSASHPPTYPSHADGHDAGRPGSIPSSERLDMSVDDSIPDGARSPGEGSEASHFTSISQRGVNPAWRPPPHAVPSSAASPPPRRKEDMILTDNPDFSLPGIGVRGGARGAAATLPRGATASPGGLTPAGRYPTEF